MRKATRRFEKNLDLPRDVPGMLNATFITRVFERGGAFSINRETQDRRGVRSLRRRQTTEGRRGARHAAHGHRSTPWSSRRSTSQGKPVSVPRLQVTLYKVQWRWWWDQSGDSLAQYAQGESTGLIKQETDGHEGRPRPVAVRDQVSRMGPLSRARLRSRRRSLHGPRVLHRLAELGRRARDQSGPAANVLTITSDKQEYKVGETATIQLPEASQGRALLTLENGSCDPRAPLARARQAGKPGANRVQIPITAGMAPNVYVAVTMVQPHAGKTNDRPIRLYGVIPLKVTDPTTKLAPAVTTAAEWAPQSKATVTVSETSGRAMDYTLAVVDEGLLGLTSFRTPNLHAEFYKREALGVSTWDLFDEVAGAYGGELDRLLALGGCDAGRRRRIRTKASRASRRW